MTTIEQLQQRLKARGFDLTNAQAEAMAIRLGGTVEAYLASLVANDAAADDYKAQTGEASPKFSAPLAYEVESLADSGLPAGDQA